MVDFQSRDSDPTHGDAVEEAGDPTSPPTGADGPDDAPSESAAVQEAGEAPGTASALGVAVVTVGADSDVDEDVLGEEVVAAVEAADAVVPSRELVAPDYDGVQQALGGLVGRRDVDAVVTLGGAGVAPDQTAVDAARALFETELPGFGEVYRARIRERSDATGIRLRTTAGVADGVPVFCLPQAPAAVDLGVRELVLPELPAILADLRA